MHYNNWHTGLYVYHIQLVAVHHKGVSEKCVWAGHTCTSSDFIQEWSMERENWKLGGRMKVEILPGRSLRRWRRGGYSEPVVILIW